MSAAQPQAALANAIPFFSRAWTWTEIDLHARVCRASTCTTRSTRTTSSTRATHTGCIHVVVVRTHAFDWRRNANLPLTTTHAHAPLAHKSYDGRWTPDRSQSRSLAIISRISRSPSRRLEHTLCDPHGAALTPTRRTALSPASTLALSRAHSTHPMQSRWLPFITPGRSLRHAGQ